MARLLLTKNTLLTDLHCHSVQDKFAQLVNVANEFNMATGFITNDSIATLQQIVKFKEGRMRLNLFIGMHYAKGFTRIQYEAVKELNDFLDESKMGSVYLSPYSLFHGKMYSFLQDGQCIGSFVGSSNLGNFVGKSPNYIEADVLFDGKDGTLVNDRILKIIRNMGKGLSELSPITHFRTPEQRLLRAYRHVEEVANDELKMLKSKKTGLRTYIPLKTAPHSNLNAYFGAGKVKDRYSPRGWYEVELIIDKKEPAMEQIPTEHPITVVTDDGSKFICERQGDNYKNFRSRYDLKILGRWIKGQM